MNGAHAAEDAVEVGEDVVGRECDELAPTPKHLAEEIVSISGVGEGDVEADDVVVVAVLTVVLALELEHGLRTRREAEVCVA